MNTKLVVRWGYDEQRVSSIRELDDLLDRITEQAIIEDLPMYVELSTDDGIFKLLPAVNP